MKISKLIGLICFFVPCFTAFLHAQCPNSYSVNVYTRPSCQLSTNGVVGLSQTTYYSASTYMWSNGATTRNIYNLSSGHYSVTVTDPTNCTYTATNYLPVLPTGLPVNPNFNQCQAKLNAGVSWPYVGPLSYMWPR